VIIVFLVSRYYTPYLEGKTGNPPPPLYILERNQGLHVEFLSFTMLCILTMQAVSMGLQVVVASSNMLGSGTLYLSVGGMLM